MAKAAMRWVMGSRGSGGAGWPLAHGAPAAQGPLAVTEELHLITFTLAYAYCGLEMQLEVRAGGCGEGWGAKNRPA